MVGDSLPVGVESGYVPSLGFVLALPSGPMRSIGALPGCSSTSLRAVNDVGQAVGDCSDAAEFTNRAILFDNRTGCSSI